MIDIITSQNSDLSSGITLYVEYGILCDYPHASSLKLLPNYVPHWYLSNLAFLDPSCTKFKAVALVREMTEFLHCLIKHHTLKTHGGGDRDVGTLWRWANSYKHPAAWPWVKNLRYALDMWLCWPQNRSRCGRKDVIRLILPGIEFRSHGFS